jgi:hypothetical protein
MTHAESFVAAAKAALSKNAAVPAGKAWCQPFQPNLQRSDFFCLLPVFALFR